MIARLRSALRDERGLGMPIAMGVLVGVLLLSGLAVTVSQSSHRNSEQDGKSKRALGPADAAIQRAAWRMDQRATLGAVGDNQCLISSTTSGPDRVVAPTSGTTCPTPDAIALGNGSQYSYVVSPVLAAGATCAGDTIVAGTFDRCLTGSGTAGDVTRRVQMRLSALPLPMFPPSGVVARDGITFNNNTFFVTCAGDPLGTVGSNGQITANAEVRFQNACGATNQSWTVTQPPTGAPAPAWSGQTYPNPPPAGTPQQWSYPEIAPWPTTDDNASIAIGGGVQWTGTRELRAQSGTVTLTTGTYVFCSVYLGNGGKVALASGAQVKIYIDSPTRVSPAGVTNPNGCAANTGFIHAQNSNGVNYNSGWAVTGPEAAAASRQLHVYVWGSPAANAASGPCGGVEGYGAVILCNSAGFAGVLYAPTSRMYIGNDTNFVGSVALGTLHVNNHTTFRFPSGLDGGSSDLADTYGGATWTECQSTPPTADPHSGCA